MPSLQVSAGLAVNCQLCHATLLHMGLIRVFSPQLSTVSSRVSWQSEKGHQLSTGVTIGVTQGSGSYSTPVISSFTTKSWQVEWPSVAISGHSPQLEESSSPVTTFCWMPSFQDPWLPAHAAEDWMTIPWVTLK